MVSVDRVNIQRSACGSNFARIKFLPLVRSKLRVQLTCEAFHLASDTLQLLCSQNIKSRYSRSIQVLKSIHAPFPDSIDGALNTFTRSSLAYHRLCAETALPHAPQDLLPHPIVGPRDRRNCIGERYSQSQQPTQATLIQYPAFHDRFHNIQWDRKIMLGNSQVIERMGRWIVLLVHPFDYSWWRTVLLFVINDGGNIFCRSHGNKEV